MEFGAGNNSNDFKTTICEEATFLCKLVIKFPNIYQEFPRYNTPDGHKHSELLLLQTRWAWCVLRVKMLAVSIDFKNTQCHKHWLPDGHTKMWKTLGVKKLTYNNWAIPIGPKVICEMLELTCVFFAHQGTILILFKFFNLCHFEVLCLHVTK